MVQRGIERLSTGSPYGQAIRHDRAQATTACARLGWVIPRMGSSEEFVFRVAGLKLDHPDARRFIGRERPPRRLLKGAVHPVQPGGRVLPGGTHSFQRSSSKHVPGRGITLT